jgi:hypothetical protein
MRRYLFFSRVALIGNIFFVLMMLMKGYHLHIPLVLEEFIIVMSLLGLVMNVLVNISGLVLWILKKNFKQSVPVWLVVVNFIILALQVFHLVHLRIN